MALRARLPNISARAAGAPLCAMPAITASRARHAVDIPACPPLSFMPYAAFARRPTHAPYRGRRRSAVTGHHGFFLRRWSLPCLARLMVRLRLDTIFTTAMPQHGVFNAAAANRTRPAAHAKGVTTPPFARFFAAWRLPPLAWQEAAGIARAIAYAIAPFRHITSYAYAHATVSLLIRHRSSCQHGAMC